MNASAIVAWDSLAESKSRFAQAIAHLDPFTARWSAKESMEAANVARSLRMEADTGISHCPCSNPPHPRAA